VGNNLGQILQKIREVKGMSLRAVEEKTKISNAYLSQLENGKAENPSPHILYKLSSLYEISYDSLMEAAGYLFPSTHQGEKKSNKNSLQEALMSAKLTTEEQSKVAEFIGYLRSQRRKKDRKK
jgi:transcriptional regulator with XRE-family HTH domain